MIGDDLLPVAQQAAQQDDLAGMIAGVIGDEQRFAQKSLAVTVREGGEEIACRVIGPCVG
jgi:hypothetical protein